MRSGYRNVCKLCRRSRATVKRLVDKRESRINLINNPETLIFKIQEYLKEIKKLRARLAEVQKKENE